MEQHETPPAVQTTEPYPPHSASIGKVAAALSKAQAAFGEIIKNQKVVIRKTAGGSYDFDYADLTEIFDKTRKGLAENGLAITSLFMPGGDANRMVLRTILSHESGEFFASTTFVNKPQQPKELGSIMTYMRRYAIQGLLGVAADKDDDGSIAQGDDITDRKQQKKPEVPLIKLPGENTETPNWAWFSDALVDAAKKDPAQIPALKEAHRVLLVRMKNTVPEEFDALTERMKELAQ